jgi:hypothetical protein
MIARAFAIEDIIHPGADFSLSGTGFPLSFVLYSSEYAYFEAYRFYKFGGLLEELLMRPSHVFEDEDLIDERRDLCVTEFR